MIRKLLNYFNKPKIEFRIIEVEKPRGIGELTPDLKATLSTLSGHPAFLYLISKLKFQRSVLENKLKSERQVSLKDVEFLQSGIYWSRWLEDQVLSAVSKTPQVSGETALTSDELAAFNQMRNSVQLVGE